MKFLKHSFLIIALLLLAVLGIQAQDGSPTPAIFNVDASAYPEVDIVFTVRGANQQAINIQQDNLTVTYGGQNLPIIDFIAGQNTVPLDLVIVFDLTTSLSGDFLGEQRQTAQQLIDSLNPNDQVAIVSFDGVGTTINQELSGDQNAAFNATVDLDIGSGQSNVFRDGVQQAVQVLNDSARPDSRRAVVVMTDVTDPEGDTDLSTTTNLATQIGAAIHMIGFAEANEDSLRAYSDATNGATFILREQDEGLSGIAARVADLLTQGFVITVTSDVPVTEGEQPLELQVSFTGGQSGSASQALAPPARPMSISFPNLEGREAFADAVTFSPEIAYNDEAGGEPELVSAEYTIVQGGGLGDTVLQPPDTADPEFTWDIEDIAGGNYTVRLTVVDNVGNEQSQDVTIEVASPLAVAFVTPPQDDPVLATDETNIQVDVTGSFGVNSAELLVNNEVVSEIVGEPEEVDENTVRLNFSLGEEGLSEGTHTLTARVIDTRSNEAQSELPITVSLDESGTLLQLLLLLGVAALLVVGGIFLAVMRRSQTSEPEAIPATPVATPPPPVDPQPVSPEPTPSSVPRLQVVSGGVGGLREYPLDRNRIRLGRGRDSDIRVGGESASREHAIIVQEGSHYVFRDLTPDKGNHSKINGSDLGGRTHTLRRGDRIQIGDTVLEFLN